MKVIDLHGIRHKDVSDVMVKYCSEYETPFEVITGNSPTMKKIVSAVAERFNLITRDSIGKTGRLVIDEARR